MSVETNDNLREKIYESVNNLDIAVNVRNNLFEYLEKVFKKMGELKNLKIGEKEIQHIIDEYLEKYEPFNKRIKKNADQRVLNNIVKTIYEEKKCQIFNEAWKMNYGNVYEWRTIMKWGRGRGFHKAEYSGTLPINDFIDQYLETISMTDEELHNEFNLHETDEKLMNYTDFDSLVENNSEKMIKDDLIMFSSDKGLEPMSVRIWTLKESNLCAWRIRIRDGDDHRPDRDGFHPFIHSLDNFIDENDSEVTGLIKLNQLNALALRYFSLNDSGLDSKDVTKFIVANDCTDKSETSIKKRTFLIRCDDKLLSLFTHSILPTDYRSRLLFFINSMNPKNLDGKNIRNKLIELLPYFIA